jgi:glycosyltransferase involved in cell wall biosynthesis
MLAALIRGHDADLQRRIGLALDRGIEGTRARSLADIALAAGHPSLADRLIQAAADCRGLESTRARRFWYAGAISEAVDVLEAGVGPAASQRRRLEAERRLLMGWKPQLPATDFKPVAGRVLHLLTNSLPHTTSGYAQRSHSILLAQKEEGWDVMAVTRIGYPVQVGKVLAHSVDVVDGVTYRRLLPASLAPTSEARLQQQTEELMRVALDFRPSILHTTTHYTNALVVRAVAQALDIPWVYEVRGQLADTWASTRSPDARNSERYRLFSAREADVMRTADHLFTLGLAMKDNVAAAGVPEERVTLTPNAVGGDFLEDPVSVATARREVGLPTEGQYIGTVTSLVPYEGIDDLIAAFGILAPAHPELRLLIVGGGTSLPALREQAKRTGFGGRIIFTGRVPRAKTPWYHQALDIFVVPRKDMEVTRSVTPLKPVEALASGRPVVASRLPALAEIVEDGRSGKLVSAGDPALLAATLRDLLQDEPLRQLMGTRGRSDILQTRTWAANARTYAQTYRKIAGQHMRRIS